MYEASLLLHEITTNAIRLRENKETFTVTNRKENVASKVSAADNLKHLEDRALHLGYNDSPYKIQKRENKENERA